MKTLAEVLHIDKGEIKRLNTNFMDLMLKVRSGISFPFVQLGTYYTAKSLRSEYNDIATGKKYRIEITEI